MVNSASAPGQSQSNRNLTNASEAWPSASRLVQLERRDGGGARLRNQADAQDDARRLTAMSEQQSARPAWASA